MPFDTPPALPNRLEAARIECVRGARALFRNLHCAVEAGAALHVRGENGAGKTSLMKILCGLHPPEAGEVLWNGAPIARDRRGYHRALSYLGHKTALKSELTPAENLAVIGAISARAAAPQAAEDALRRLGLRECMHTRCALLSAGQLQRAALAALLLRPGGVWILDEPAAALDAGGIRELEAMLAEQTARGGMVIFSSHQKLAPRAPLQSLTLGDYR